MESTNNVVDAVEIKSDVIENRVQKKNWQRDISGGVVLILLGTIFLLNTLGYLPWSIWSGFFITMLRFWPILIISIGVRIMLGSNKFLKLVSDIVWLLLLLLAFGISIVNYTGESIIKEKLINRFPFLVTINQSLNSSNIEKTDDIKITKKEGDTYKEMDINLNVVAGEFNLVDSDISDYLTLNSKYSQNGGVPSIKESKVNDTLSVDFKQEYKSQILQLNTESEYNLVVGQYLPINKMYLNLTAGKTNLTLSKVKTKSIDLKMTAGDTSLSFTEESLPERIDIKLVAGSLDISLPSNIGVEVNSNAIAGNSTFNNTKLSNNGMSQFNTDKAKKVIINIDQTAGDISIKTK